MIARRSNRPTLQAVADEAGVHRSTASRALNHATAHLLTAELCERVRSASRALGYQRDVAAASLRTRRSLLVGVLVPDIANPVFGPILSGLEAALTAAGYSLLIANTGSDRQRQIMLAEDLIARQIEGLVLATVSEDDPVLAICLAAGLPTVLVNRAEARRRACAVVSDDIAGMRLAVEHLTALGHRRIGHLGGPAHLSTGRLRREGFARAMEAANCDATAVAIAAAYTRDAGLVAARSLLDRYSPTAIVAANDLLALGAYLALAERGLGCPRDVSVVGHNDMPLMDMVEPPLTTIRINPEKMGRETAALLLQRIAAPDAAPVMQVWEPEFVRRSSTAAILQEQRYTR